MAVILGHDANLEQSGADVGRAMQSSGQSLVARKSDTPTGMMRGQAGRQCSEEAYY
jgi:hypothetical protein